MSDEVGRLGALKTRTLTASYVVALFILVVAGLYTLYGVRQTMDMGRWVEHTYQVLSRTETTFSDMLATESSGRGYVLSKDPVFLAGFKTMEAKVKADQLDFANLTADNPAQRNNSARLAELTKQKLAQSERLISLDSSPNPDIAAVRSETTQGRKLMQQIRDRIDLMESEERRLLTKRQANVQVLGTTALVSCAITVIAAILLLTGVYSLSTRLISSLRLAQERQQTYNLQLEEEVERTNAAQRELERSNRELQDFAFVASHDLQEPLRKIRAYGDRIRVRLGDSLDPTSATDLMRVQNAAERMQGLINDILSLSRVTTKGQPFAMVDLNKVFQEVVDDLETRIQQSSAIVTKENLPKVEADPVQMRQLMQNLIANALKFIKPDEQPKIIVRPNPDAGKNFTGFIVSDNGIGFDEHHAEKIFTIFQRLHSRSEYEGSGIGLSICRRIVERHGGRIEAKGVSGQGAAFIVTLPKTQSKREKR